MTLVALGLFAWGLVLNTLGTVVMLRVIFGNLDLIKVLTPAFWAGACIAILPVLVSMGVSILLAAALPIVSRSLSFGLAGALGWFAADNIVVLFLRLIAILTNNDAWLKVSGYLLGPELNAMPSIIVPALTITGAFRGQVVSRAQSAPTLGIGPWVNYDGTHAVVVALIYSLVFATVAMIVIWRRDVLD
jgi:hypothetical protein